LSSSCSGGNRATGDGGNRTTRWVALGSEHGIIAGRSRWESRRAPEVIRAEIANGEFGECAEIGYRSRQHVGGNEESVEVRQLGNAGGDFAAEDVGAERKRNQRFHVADVAWDTTGEAVVEKVELDKFGELSDRGWDRAGESILLQQERLQCKLGTERNGDCASESIDAQVKSHERIRAEIGNISVQLIHGNSEVQDGG